MINDPDYLVVYGTLRPSFTNPFAQYLRQHSQYVGEGSFPGLLFDVGNYPGAVYVRENTQRVHGTIYEINHHKEPLLTYLDDYEGTGEQFAQPSEYIRAVVPVDYKGNSIGCWAYLYNLPFEGKQVILSGDYTHYVGR